MNEASTKKTAIIAGGTGLVGELLLYLLLADERYGKVITFTRKPSGIRHEKLDERVIDFEKLPSSPGDIRADHGYCCLGTTIKTAGSKERQYKVDHDFVVNFARSCLAAGVTRFSVVSSIGADPSSSNFYLRTKGEMERDLKSIPFPGLVILQPSLLLGDRKEHRAGEKAATVIMKIIAPLMIGGLKNYRGVRASDVARTMIRETCLEITGTRVIPSGKIR